MPLRFDPAHSKKEEAVNTRTCKTLTESNMYFYSFIAFQRQFALGVIVAIC